MHIVCGLTREENEVESSRVGGGETLGVGG